MTDLTKLVKPLVWEALSPRHYRAPTALFGSIRVESWGRGYSVTWSVPGMCDTFTPGEWPTAAAAQAAAQADYTARILAVLDTDALSDMLAENVKLQGQLKMVLDREAANIKRADAKMDTAEAALAALKGGDA